MQRKFEFGDPANQELNKKNLSQGKTYLKTLVPKSKTSTMLHVQFTIYDYSGLLDVKRPKEIHSIHCFQYSGFTLYTLSLKFQVNKKYLS